EEGTLARLKALRREFFEPKVREHRGRIVKLMGDGALVEFASAVDAVRCAVAVQEGLAEREAGAAEDSALALRLGINLGDIIIDSGDIYGDGVNVAARLEGLAEPGGICLSASIHEQVRHKLALGLEDLGEQSVKNIAEPVRVYRVVTDAPAAASRGEPSLALPDRPSIAVLPFDNMSGDPEQDYLADGISEDLITALSKIRWFFVIARNSSFTYKGQAVEVTQVARELGVRYVLEGSVRKAGGRVRITAQLVDATTGKHVWAERYDRDLADIFELQDEMTQTIVAAVEPELGAAERERALSKPPENLDAWETYQRGLWHMWSYTKDDNAKAPHLLRRAHELEPGFAAAYAHEAYSHYLNVIMGWAEDPDNTLAAGMAAAKKALALDDKDAVAYVAAGRLHMMLGEHDASIAALETSLTLNPNFAQAYYGLGFALTLAGRLEDALDNFAKAERLSPRDPLLWGFMVLHALACILSHEYEAAVHWAQKTIQIPRATGHWPYAALAAALAHVDQMDEARAAVQAALEQRPDLSLSYLKKTLPTKHPGGLDPYLDGLRKAGLPSI
ncbi:MAG: tetratricopeptide repeat protein, partial [Alphaproteobacteria bacterium]